MQIMPKKLLPGKAYTVNPHEDVAQTDQLESRCIAYFSIVSHCFLGTPTLVMANTVHHRNA